MKGFSANLTKEELNSVRQNPLVKYVEQDQVMRAAACSTPTPVSSWGLTRISEKKISLDGLYQYPTSAGIGVTAYVIDTGIYVEHSEFSGRARFGFKSNVNWTDTDGNGHGTHVAGIIAGANYGVARKADVVAVKVLGEDGSGTNAGVIAGVDWVVEQYISNKKASSINMAIGGGFSSAMNDAVNKAVTTGIVVVVAAGGSNADACSMSPASAAEVLTVGSTTKGNDGMILVDLRSSYSNYGKCVGLFAPGNDITAAWIGSTTAVRTISGTSPSTAHVCGVATLYMSEHPNEIASAVQTAVVEAAIPGEINLLCNNAICRATPNLLTNNGCFKV